MSAVALGSSEVSGGSDVGSLAVCGEDELADAAVVVGVTWADVGELVVGVGAVVDDVPLTDVVGAVESVAGDAPVEQAVNRGIPT